jgi:type III restriction enzyme
MILKQYQDDTLSILRRFFEEARLRGAKAAYEGIVSEPDQARRLRGFGGAYEPLLGLEDMPYVCLRLPTGGGKTLLSAHAIGVAKDAWIEKDYPVVLWLAPTNIIRQQTVDALKNPNHAYRRAMDDAFDGRVRVFDIGDFTQVRPHDIGRQLCVIVGTIQTLRVDNTDGRKVYAHNENLEPHFSGIDPGREGLERREDGGIRFSFANLLHIHQPLMIVDEAHKAVTGLSRDMQARVNPCAVIEFTATPQKKSNILHSVSALELKDEEMIKLPVRLEEHDTWQGAVAGAMTKRAELAEAAKADRGGYIRPIVLFQAEDRNREVTVEVLKQHLLDQGIDKDAIVVATGDQRGLNGIDLFKPECPVEYVITVEALKEGWDCSFAYVFCSVANIKSATDAEQLLGRVLRMPYAKRRKADSLNRAYANLVSKSFAEAANTLRDRLVDMGFEEKEAEANIEVAPQRQLDEGLFGMRQRPKPSVRIAVEADSETLAAVKAAVPDKISIETGADGSSAIKVTGPLRAEELDRLVYPLPERTANAVREEVAKFHAEIQHEVSAAELGKPFIVPRLMTWVQGDLILADTDLIAEYFDWSLADKDFQLSEADFSVRQTSSGFEIDLEGDSLMLRHHDHSDQLLLDVAVDGWSEAGLVQLLDRQVRDQFIGQGELIRWLIDVVNFLTGPRGIPLATLMRCRFILARKLKEKIARIRAHERSKAYQQSLFAADAKPQLDFENGFRFFEGMYDGQPMFTPKKFQLKKHFLGWDRIPLFDGKGEDGDEFKAAIALDSLPQVDYWLRNISQHPASFWFPLAGGRTYPDFVAKLKDGRTMVVEYKGAHLVDGSDEKRAIGEKWQAASGLQAIYVFLEKGRASMDVRQQLLKALGEG